jgi:hypothetical protein
VSWKDDQIIDKNGKTLAVGQHVRVRSSEGPIVEERDGWCVSLTSNGAASNSPGSWERTDVGARVAFDGVVAYTDQHGCAVRHPKGYGSFPAYWSDDIEVLG